MKPPGNYAAVPMRTTLDGLVARLDEQYGFTLPLSEFTLSDPYADFRRRASTVTYCRPLLNPNSDHETERVNCR
jgi:hypothetical protein